MFKKLKNSLFLSKTNVIGSYLWFVGTAFFIAVIYMSTNGFTSDPCYGVGCPEHTFLLPMLASFGVGFGFFGITILTGIMRVLLKAKKWTPPFNISSWAVGFITFLITLVFGAYGIGSLRKASLMWNANYTGEELFNAVNEHRGLVGAQEVVIGEGLCDNLVSRWQAVKDEKQHEGFEEWIEKEGIQTNYGYYQVVELYIISQTPEDAIDFWIGSPGHKIQLENPVWTDGCAYAGEGYGVVIMGYK